MAGPGNIDRGAGLTDLKSLYEAFQKKEGEVRDLISLLDSKSHDSHGYWKGPGADRFRDDWRGFKPSLDKLADSLGDAYKSAKSSHDRIDDATR
ncbi:WXG100 family type VII secretion target [Streptomyces sp. NPDC056670]|uniref:WXG100 family type VII secretion target n=1 Tax=Streptomyces sp. NPDC056670 TaxID=3345904 RepID=UPI00367EC133